MIQTITIPIDRSGATIQELVRQASNFNVPILFLGDDRFTLDVPDSALDRMQSVLDQWDAGIVYSDSHGQRRIDYQMGSIRDDFDFGPLVAVSVSRALAAFEKYGWPDTDIRWGGFYDLRLKLSADAPIVRIPEPLYHAMNLDRRSAGERLFDYINPSGHEYQIEMEHIATEHLKQIGAFLSPREVRVTDNSKSFSVKASVVIPVRNRALTIRNAIDSALAQNTNFRFNVVVVDNHSTDDTGRVLAEVTDPRVVLKVPKRTDLEIGGCWQKVVMSEECGRYALQLDSDDLFIDSNVLSRVVGELESERYAMLVGSYTTVNFDLEEVSPGLVDHREWTSENGHNNVLRVNGFGAPRAFDVSIVRKIGFPNVSYGEDYAVGLRVSREYTIGRIYESLYLCRRWEGNTDSAPTEAQINQFNNYKDWLRTCEIKARIAQNWRYR